MGKGARPRPRQPGRWQKLRWRRLPGYAAFEKDTAIDTPEKMGNRRRRPGRPPLVHQVSASRWKVERSHGWLDNWGRVVTRYDWYTESYVAFLTIACFMVTLARILLQRILGCWTRHPRLMTLSQVQGYSAPVSGRGGAVVPVPGRRTPAGSSLQNWSAAGVWQDWEWPRCTARQRRATGFALDCSAPVCLAYPMC